MANNTPQNGTATVATDEVGGIHYQIVKVAFGAEDSATPVSSGDSFPTISKSISVPYYPQYAAPPSSVSDGIPIDPSGNVSVRGSVLTDESTFRINFANTSLEVSIGSVTVSGTTVTGAGFSTTDIHLNDYFKLDADAESKWTQIESIDSDTQLTLKSTYTGSASGAASRALVRTETGSGGSISVASGQCTIASGTTNSAITRICRAVDVAPLVYRARFSVSQRIANQTIRAGLSEPIVVNDRWFARFKIDGTTNTTVICESGRNPTTTPSASETESTTITLPDGLTTATAIEYRVEQMTESVKFYINGINVATHTKTIPAQHDEMEASVAVINGTGAASSTSVVCDYLTTKNHNKLEIGVFSDTEQIIANAVPLKQYSYSQAGIIPINTNLLVIDCLQLRSLLIQCTSMGTTGVVTVQWANDAAFTAPITATLLSESGATSTTFNAAVFRVTNVMARYCRLRLTTATTAGTTTINVWGNQQPIVPIITTQSVSGTVSVTGYPTAAASADASANPTVTKIDSTGLLFNGSTWDRARGMSTALTTGDTGTKTATGNGVTITNIGNKGVQILLNLGTVTGTTPTLVLKVQGSVDGGTLWYDIPGAATASLTATGQYGITIYPGIATTVGTTTSGTTASVSYAMPRTWRVVWTIGGTTPSFTITAVQYMYLNN